MHAQLIECVLSRLGLSEIKCNKKIYMSKILTFQVVVVAVQVELAVAGFERRVAIFVLQYCHDEVLRQEGSKIERTPTQVSPGFVTFTRFFL